jgi:hypothetical protein
MATPGFGDVNGPIAAAPNPPACTGAAMAMVPLDFSMRLMAITKNG